MNTRRLSDESRPIGITMLLGGALLAAGSVATSCRSDPPVPPEDPCMNVSVRDTKPMGYCGRNDAVLAADAASRGDLTHGRGRTTMSRRRARSTALAQRYAHGERRPRRGARPRGQCACPQPAALRLNEGNDR